jgi:CSLREA domain-containing protein
VFIALLVPAAAPAATITPNTTADEDTSVGTNCSLREAIIAANTDGNYNDCVATGGAMEDENADTIVLAAGATYGRTVSDPLTIETEPVTITGNGAIVKGNDVQAQDSIFDIPDSTATISGVTVRDGYADVGGQGGGFAVGSGATLNLRKSTVTSNISGLAGGGIDSFFSTIDLENVTVSGNTSGNGGGGGLNFDNGSSVLNNVTVTDNHELGSGKGGGMYVTETTHTFLNSIVAGNTTAGGLSPDCFEDPLATLVSAGHMLIGDPSGCSYTPGTGDLYGPAGLGPLADNGGGTPTHGLQPGSQAIDAGNPATPDGSAFHCESTDQRGVARPVGPFCDIGAFEGTLPLPAPPGATTQIPQAIPAVGPTGLRAVALKKCKKKKSAAARRKCKRRANLLPV